RRADRRADGGDAEGKKGEVDLQSDGRTIVGIVPDRRLDIIGRIGKKVVFGDDHSAAPKHDVRIVPGYRQALLHQICLEIDARVRPMNGWVRGPDETGRRLALRMGKLVPRTGRTPEFPEPAKQPRQVDEPPKSECPEQISDEFDKPLEEVHDITP